jgi:hypothetical protein
VYSRHLTRDPLHRAGADAALSSNLQHALAGPQLSLDSFFNGRVDPRPAKLLALFYGPFKPGIDPLPDHAAAFAEFEQDL